MRALHTKRKRIREMEEGKPTDEEDQEMKEEIDEEVEEEEGV